LLLLLVGALLIYFMLKIFGSCLVVGMNVGVAAGRRFKGGYKDGKNRLEEELKEVVSFH